MKETELYGKIISASEQAKITPSDGVWNKLEARLNEQEKAVSINPPVLRLSFLSMAASLIILVGLVGFLLTYSSKNSVESIIQLEDLHTLEINSKFNTPKAGDATTLPSMLLAEPMMTSYSSIEEGPAGKKLIDRSKVQKKTPEYGLG